MLRNESSGKRATPFAGLGRCDDRMTLRAGMLAGVPVRRRIAAQRNATRLAGAQMDPLRTNPDALLAHSPSGCFTSSIDAMCAHASTICCERIMAHA